MSKYSSFNWKVQILLILWNQIQIWSKFSFLFLSRQIRFTKEENYVLMSFWHQNWAQTWIFLNLGEVWLETEKTAKKRFVLRSHSSLKGKNKMAKKYSKYFYLQNKPEETELYSRKIEGFKRFLIKKNHWAKVVKVQIRFGVLSEVLKSACILPLYHFSDSMCLDAKIHRSS